MTKYNHIYTNDKEKYFYYKMLITLEDLTKNFDKNSIKAKPQS